MALCLFRCLTACGCRDCLINKLAFYPPSAGYRFEEISTPLKKIKDSVVGSSIPNRQSSCRRSTIQNKDTPRFTSIPSVDSRYYKFILVYEDQELKSSREPSQARQEQVNPQNSKQELSEENSQKIQPAISQGKSDVQQKNNKTTAKKKGVPEKREEEFSQVEDLNLICFKRQNRLGTLICGYHIEYTHRRSDMVIIYSHGNSTDIGYMINQALDVAYNLRTNLIAFDYSGYGQSGGKPSEKSCIYDLEAMYLLARELGYSPVNIVLYGQSVGSGPSTFLASQKRFPIGGLIIHSGFASGLRITQDAQKALSSKTSSKDFFPNREFIRKVNAPIMIIHGTDDTDIRMHHANELYAQAKKHYTPSILKVEGAGHNDIEHDDNHRKVYFVKLREFVSFLRKNRNALHEACKGPKEGKSVCNDKRDDRGNSYTLKHPSQSYARQQSDESSTWKKGFAGDGWSPSFNHIYKGYFTPSPSQNGLSEQIEEDYEQEIRNKNNSYLGNSSRTMRQAGDSINRQRNTEKVQETQVELNGSINQGEEAVVKGQLNRNNKGQNSKEEGEGSNGRMLNLQTVKGPQRVTNIGCQDIQVHSQNQIGQNQGSQNSVFNKNTSSLMNKQKGGVDLSITPVTAAADNNNNTNINNIVSSNNSSSNSTQGNNNTQIKTNLGQQKDARNVSSIWLDQQQQREGQSYSFQNVQILEVSQQDTEKYEGEGVNNEQEDDVEEEESKEEGEDNDNQMMIRSHKVTSVIRKKHSSYFSAYILDNSGNNGDFSDSLDGSNRLHNANAMERIPKTKMIQGTQSASKINYRASLNFLSTKKKQNEEQQSNMKDQEGQENKEKEETEEQSPHWKQQVVKFSSWQADSKIVRESVEQYHGKNRLYCVGDSIRHQELSEEGIAEAQNSSSRFSHQTESTSSIHNGSRDNNNNINNNTSSNVTVNSENHHNNNILIHSHSNTISKELSSPEQSSQQLQAPLLEISEVASDPSNESMGIPG